MENGFMENQAMHTKKKKKLQLALKNLRNTQIVASFYPQK